MRLHAEELGIELGREDRAYLEYAMFAALRQYLPQVACLYVCLRRSGVRRDTVTCVAAAELIPSGRAVAVRRTRHPRAAIDRVARDLRTRVRDRLPASHPPRRA